MYLHFYIQHRLDSIVLGMRFDCTEYGLESAYLSITHYQYCFTAFRDRNMRNVSVYEKERGEEEFLWSYEAVLRVCVCVCDL